MHATQSCEALRAHPSLSIYQHSDKATQGQKSEYDYDEKVDRFSRCNEFGLLIQVSSTSKGQQRIV